MVKLVAGRMHDPSNPAQVLASFTLQSNLDSLPSRGARSIVIPLACARIDCVSARRRFLERQQPSRVPRRESLLHCPEIVVTVLD
jgi:hypothetical protein